MTGAPAPIVVATILRRDGPTGVHTHVRELQRYLACVGEACQVVTPFSRHRWAAPLAFGPRLLLGRLSGPAEVLWYRHWHRVFLQDALALVLEGMGEAVIYAQGPEAAEAALRARRTPRQKVVMAVHFHASQADGWVEKKRVRRGSKVFEAIRAKEREVVPQVDGIVFVSRSARDELLRWLPEAAQVPSEVVHNFVAPSAAPRGGQSLGDLVTVGSLHPPKNHEFLLAVLAEANRTGTRLSLDIFGDGPNRRHLKRLAASLRVGGQVRFRGFRPDVRELLPRYRAYVHASRTETGPLAIIEAMAAGLPIVAGKWGSVPELFDDGAEGRFWPLDDPAEAAAVLLQVMATDDWRREASAAARSRFERCFDSRVLAPKLVGFLQARTAGHVTAGALASVDTMPLDEGLGRVAGGLLGKAQHSDVI
jgi:glycosyltransferase involved in cell wall biosynthesis